MRHLSDPAVLGLVVCYLFLIGLLFHAAENSRGKTWRDLWEELKASFTKARK